jgi:WD40 repeat protein
MSIGRTTLRTTRPSASEWAHLTLSWYAHCWRNDSSELVHCVVLLAHRLQEILQKGNFNPQSAGMCRHYSRKSCRFTGNCWSIHASPETPLMVGGAAATDGAVVAGGAVAAPACLYTLPAAGQGLSHAAPVTAITTAVDKNWLISGAEDGSVLVWDLSTCEAAPGPACAAPVTSVLYADGWLFCGTRAGGLTGHHTV